MFGLFHKFSFYFHKFDHFIPLKHNSPTFYSQEYILVLFVFWLFTES